MNYNSKYWFPRPGSYSNDQMCGLRQSLCFPFCDRDAEESLYKLGCEPGMVVPTCNPSTAEAREGEQEVSGRPEPQAKFQASLGSTCKTQNKKQEIALHLQMTSMVPVQECSSSCFLAVTNAMTRSTSGQQRFIGLHFQIKIHH